MLNSLIPCAECAAKIVATAEEVATGQQIKEKRRLWTFLNSSAQLSISWEASDTSWNKGPILYLRGSIQNQVCKNSW